jgi:hypothetical protein
MKVILFLAAVYALIFYQNYKMEKYRIFPAPAKEVIKNRDLIYPAGMRPENYVSADQLGKRQYSSYQNSPQFALFRGDADR